MTKKEIEKRLNQVFGRLGEYKPSQKHVNLEYYLDYQAFAKITMPNGKIYAFEFYFDTHSVGIISYKSEKLLLGKFTKISSKSELMTFKKVPNFHEILFCYG